jgi:tRNA1Val (adenine37-N6)-methyltransferase
MNTHSRFADARLESITAHAADLRDYVKEGTRCGQMDVVFANPPYMVSSGKGNRAPEKQAARHEVFGGIFDFAAAAARLLRYGGRFYCVYRPDRLIDLLADLRENKLEPKRMTFVHADVATPPSMVLVEGRRGGNASLKLTKPLIIYTDNSHKTYTEDMEYIMNLGSFPQDFSTVNTKRKSKN